MIIKNAFLNITTCLLLAVTSQNLSAAGIHKWTDENGKVHYSQVAPNKIKTEEIAPPPPPAVGPNVAEEKLNDRIEANRKAEQEQYIADQEADNLKRNQEIQKKNCSAAKQNLDSYRSSPRVRVKEEDGSFRRLTEEQRQERIVEMKGNVTEYCDSPLPEAVSAPATKATPELPPQDPQATATNKAPSP